MGAPRLRFWIVLLAQQGVEVIEAKIAVHHSADGDDSFLFGIIPFTNHGEGGSLRA
jgi:hypothetical protein